MAATEVGCPADQSFAALLHETIAQNKLSGSRVKAVTESATQSLSVRRLSHTGPAGAGQGAAACAYAVGSQDEARVAVPV